MLRYHCCILHCQQGSYNLCSVLIAAQTTLSGLTSMLIRWLCSSHMFAAQWHFWPQITTSFLTSLHLIDTKTDTGSCLEISCAFLDHGSLQDLSFVFTVASPQIRVTSRYLAPFISYYYAHKFAREIAPRISVHRHHGSASARFQIHRDCIARFHRAR